MLDHAVELEHLPRGDFKSPIPILVCNLIYQKPLLWAADHVSWNLNADQERMGRFYTLGLTVVLNITVVRLVDAVEPGELGVGWGEHTGGVVHETSADCSSKVLRSGFDVFVGKIRLGSASVISVLSMPNVFHSFGSQSLYPFSGPSASWSSPSPSSTKRSAPRLSSLAFGSFPGLLYVSVFG